MEILAYGGIPATQGNIELYGVAHVDEAFFTSAAFSILPCTKINGLAIGAGEREPIYKRLLDARCMDVRVDALPQTKAFAAEAGGILSAGIDSYSFRPTRVLSASTERWRGGS
jgi:hypothetical protein